MTVRSRSIPQSPPVATWSVYCLKCWLIALLSVFTVVAPIPELLTEPSGLQFSASQPLVSTQFVAVFSCWPASKKPKILSPVPLRRQKKKKKKKAAWTECIWFTSNVFYLLFWIFQPFFHCIVLACKEWNTVCLLTGLCKISWIVFIKSTIAAKESSAKEIIRHSKEKKASLLNVQI